MKGNDAFELSLLQHSPIGFVVVTAEDPADVQTLRQFSVNRAACDYAPIDQKNNNSLWHEAYPELRESEFSDVLEQVLTEGGSGDWKLQDMEKNPICRGTAWRASRDVVVSTIIQERGRQSENGRMQQQVSELEDMVAIQERDVETVNKELMAFTYSVSHDLRSPLRRLDGFSQELLNSYEDQLDETGRHYLSRIRKSAQNMGDLIDALLKLSRISRKKVSVERVDLGELSYKIIREFKESEPGREITFETKGDLIVEADPGLMHVLMQNLLSNAWKFTGNESMATISVGSTRSEGHSAIYVRDNGVGFDMKHAENLFRAFQRLHSARTFDGTGIGLATVQRIINLHGGKIWVESEPGEGTTFYFYVNR